MFFPSRSTLSKFPSCLLVWSLAFPVSRRKVSRDFLSPFFHPFPTVFHPRYRPISASQYSACAIVFLETARDKACGLWAKFLRPNPGYVDFSRRTLRTTETYFLVQTGAMNHESLSYLFPRIIYKFTKYRNFIFRCFPSLPLYHFYRSI